MQLARKQRSTESPPKGSIENHRPRSLPPVFRTPCHAVLRAQVRLRRNPQVLLRFRQRDPPRTKITPSSHKRMRARAQQNRGNSRQARNRRRERICDAGRGRSASRSHKPTQRKTHCAAYKAVPRCWPRVSFRTAARACATRKGSAAYEKNRPRQTRQRQARKRRNGTGKSRIPARNDRLGFSSIGRSRTNSQNASDGNQSWKKRPEKTSLVVVPGFFQQPQCRQRSDNRSDRVHQSFKPESAPVSVRRNVRGQQRFLCRRPNSTAQPCHRASDQHLISVRGE